MSSQLSSSKTIHGRPAGSNDEWVTCCEGEVMTVEEAEEVVGWLRRNPSSVSGTCWEYEIRTVG